MALKESSKEVFRSMNFIKSIPGDAVRPAQCLCIHAIDGDETYKIDNNTIGVRPIWHDAIKNPPKEKGRYLIMATFVNPCKCIDKIVRENILFVSNYIPGTGWLNKCDEHTITHWMEIPPI
jgi:hypothetical protein